MSNQVRIVRNMGSYPPWTFGIALEVKVPVLSTGWAKVYDQNTKYLHQIWVKWDDCGELINPETSLKVVENNLPKYENPPESSEEISKPPLGLMPRYIHDEKRLNDIVEAITRTVNKSKLIPTEWIEEYIELVTKINKK